MSAPHQLRQRGSRSQRRGGPASAVVFDAPIARVAAPAVGKPTQGPNSNEARRGCAHSRPGVGRLYCQAAQSDGRRLDPAGVPWDIVGNTGARSVAEYLRDSRNVDADYRILNGGFTEFALRMGADGHLPDHTVFEVLSIS